METFSIYKAADVLGMNHLKIREWYKHNYIPLDDNRRAEGPGHKTDLHREDLYRIKLFQYLRNFRMDRWACRIAMKESDVKPWSGYLVCAQNPSVDEGSLWHAHFKKIQEMFHFRLGNGNEKEAVAAIIISLQQIKDEVDSLIDG